MRDILIDGIDEVLGSRAERVSSWQTWTQELFRERGDI